MANRVGSPASAAGDRVEETEGSLEKIKKQLTSASGRTLLQGPILKRSETLRKWNERWVTLDPTTGKMEYRARRNELVPKGTIIFDASSTITVSPVNFHGLQKYDGCCFYIATPQKKEYFLCCETPGAARAWVATLRASQLVLRAHREAVNSLSGNGSTKLGTVAAVVAAANSTARESAKEIGAAMQISMKAALGAVTNQANDGCMDDLTIMKETLRVKDEELHQLARELRARDSTIKEIADKLSETAEAAESAASAAHAMDKERKAAMVEIERLSREMDDSLRSASLKFRASDEKVALLMKERDHLMKQRDAALQEAQLWRAELAKAREHAVIMEAAVLRAEERAKLSAADAEAKVKEATEKEEAAMNAKEEVLKEMQKFKAQIRRSHPDADRPDEIADGERETCVYADLDGPMKTSEISHNDGIEGAHFSAAAIASVPTETCYVTFDETKVQPLDQSTQATIQPTYVANPNERIFVAETEHGHFQTQGLVSLVDQDQKVGSSGGQTLPVNSVDENSGEEVQHLYSSTKDSHGF